MKAIQMTHFFSLATLYLEYIFSSKFSAFAMPRHVSANARCTSLAILPIANLFEGL